MTALTLDQKYQELLAHLKTLNEKYDRFINGKPSDTVSIEGGPNIKSLSGIASELKSFKYVQRVINHRIYSDMVADTIEDGMLIRVWGDEVAVNGLYLKDLSNAIVYSKVSYSDLYDLRDFLPNPWNYTSISKDYDTFNKDLDLATYAVPNSAFETNARRISGSAVYSMDGVSARGSVSFDFAIVTSTGEGTNRVQNMVVSNQVKLAIDQGFDDLIMPQLVVTSLVGALDTDYTVSTTAFRTPDGLTTIPAKATINFYHVDDSFKTIS